MQKSSHKLTLRQKRTIRNTMTGYSFIILNVLGVLLFYVLPLIFSIILSFSKWDQSQGLSGIHFAGLKNYFDIWTDEWFRVSLLNNIAFTVMYVVILMSVSFLMALFLKEKVIGKRLVQLGVYLPYVVNVVAIASIFLALFSSMGPINSFLRFIGIDDPPRFLNESKYALFTVTLISVWQAAGYTAMLFLVGLVNVPEDLYEAARIDGAGWWAKLRHVTIPMLHSTSFFIMITTIINSFKVFGLINIMTSGGPGNATTMLVYNIYRTAFRFNKIEFASAQGVVLLVIIFIVSMIQMRYQNKKYEGM